MAATPNFSNMNPKGSAAPLVAGGVPSLSALQNTPLETIPLSDATLGAMQGQAQTVAGTPAAIVSGVGSDTAGMTVPSSIGRQYSALGMPNEAGNVNDPTSILGALNLRNQRAADTYVSNLKRNVELNSPAILSEGENQVAQNLSSVGQIQAANYQIMTQQNLNKQRIQAFEQNMINQIMGSILGLGAGVAVGAATAGALK